MWYIRSYKKECSHKPGKARNTQKISQLYYREKERISQMIKYKIDYDEVAETNALVLIEAVARYMSSSDYPNVADIASILGIKEEENS